MSELTPQSYTVLVVDDTPTNLKVLADYLSLEGFRVLVARSGESALQRAKYGQPDIILLDVLMPGINGFETCRQLKANPETQQIPVIFMTALSETENKVQGFQMGAVDYVTKPIQQEEVLARVKTHLKIRDLTNTLERRVVQRTSELRDALEDQSRLTEELSRALAQAEELQAIQRRVINVVSHEFRTPLNVINGSSHLLANYMDRMTPDKRTTVSQRIVESISYMTTLLDNVLYTSTIDHEDSVSLALVPTDVAALCRTARESVETQYGSREVELRFAGLDELLTTDETLLMQIVKNLLSNAYKFSPADTPIYLEASYDLGWLKIELRDRGIGVPQEDQARIFDLFYRGNNTIGVRGLGLGLSITKRLVRTLGGEIRVHSDGIDKGTCFYVRLPVEPDVKPKEALKMALVH